MVLGFDFVSFVLIFQLASTEALVLPPLSLALYALLQVCTVTVCVLRDAGAPTAPCPATVKMGLRAPLTMASVNVRLDSEEPRAKEVSVSLGNNFHLPFLTHDRPNDDLCSIP